jgi:hypothetical protein
MMAVSKLHPYPRRRRNLRVTLVKIQAGTMAGLPSIVSGHAFLLFH